MTHLPAGGYASGSANPNWQHLAQYIHDADAWCDAFARAGDGTSHPDMRLIQGLRKLIWLQTEAAIRLSLNNQSTGPRLEWPLSPNPAPPTMLFTNSTYGSTQAEGMQRYEVLQRDMLEVAGELASQGKTVAVLNMANAFHPGGGVCDGVGAQEENLHRRTDLHRYTVMQRRNYPIRQDACLLSEGVTIMRGSEKDGYPFLLGQMHRITVISCAALSKPRLNNDSSQYANPADEALMKTKIAVILNAAAHARCNAVVLSAFGCGAFGNPPKVIAEMFYDGLRRSPIQGAVFCIFDDHNAYRAHNPRGNFLPFQEVFGRR
jgi:uncharacterized protein (TIGR02452 family)